MLKEFKLLQSDGGVFYANFNDLVIEDYDIKLIDSKEKLQQQICKALLTLRSTLPLFPNYGTTITLLANNRTSAFYNQDLKDEILWALKYVKEMNKSEDINIDVIENVALGNSDPRELTIRITLLLTDGTYLVINESAKK